MNKEELFQKEKNLLDTFLSNRAISRAQYVKSITDLIEKMGIRDYTEIETDEQKDTWKSGC